MSASAGNDPRAAKAAQRLNDTYYAASPADHFRARAGFLASFDEGVDRTEPPNSSALSRDVLERLPGWTTSLDVDDADAGRDVDKAVLTIESFMLAHHAGESVLRNLLAQIDSRPLAPPWFTLTALRGKFKERVRELSQLPDNELHRLVTWAFFGERETLVAAVGEEVAAEAELHCVRWIQHFIWFHLETANGYNAAKHGLGAFPTHQRISFHPSIPGQVGSGADPVPRTVVLLEGAILETLEHEKQAGGRTWLRVIRTVDPAGLIATTLIAAELLEMLWTVGRLRHLGVSAYCKVPTGPSPADVMHGHGKEWGSFKVPLAVLPLDSDAAHEVLRNLRVADDAPNENVPVPDTTTDAS